MSIRVGVLTVSDRSARGERPDVSGPLIVARVKEQGWQAIRTGIVADDFEQIKNTLLDWCTRGEMDLILTTGGTGFAPRDITPEATQAVIQRPAPGIGELMRLNSLKVTPYAALSRAIAGIRGRTLMINLPGSPKAVSENLDTLFPIIPHAIQLLREEAEAEAGHQKF